MITRKLSQELLIAIEKMPVVSLTGPRQSGKTTLVRDTFPDYHYVNLEERDVQSLALNDPRAFLESLGSSKVIIDEAQRAPDLFSYIQVIVDENESAKFILTGSQNFLLLEKITQSLAGRARILNLLPPSIEELRLSGYNYSSASSYIFKGSYPRLYKGSLSPKEWLPSYTQTYVERDVRDLVNVKYLKQFQTFLGICAGRLGQIINYTDVSNAVGVTDKTIKHWISILEASYIIYMLPPYFKNLGKRLIKSPKIYFYDTGLACNLLDIRDENQVLTHYQYGSLFENMLINEVMKSFTNKGERPSLYFWRESNGTEIDLLLDRGGKLLPIEIKSSHTLRTDFLKNINRVRKLPKAFNMTEGYAVYGGDTSFGRNISWKDLQKEILEKLEG